MQQLLHRFHWIILGSIALVTQAMPPKSFVFSHMADASAAEYLGDNQMVVANDEDNVLRVYDVQNGGAPLTSWDLAPFMALSGKSLEMDIEGSAKVGDLIYWITSHAPNKNGKARPNRKRFFATRVELKAGKATFQMHGKPVMNLIQTLEADARYRPLGLMAATLKPPKTRDGLNIEALCERADGTLLIGFRSPIVDRQALLAPLLNPLAVVQGEVPHWGAPIFLDLGGQGIRSMIRLGDDFLIAAGSATGGGRPQFYRWDGHVQLHLIPALAQDLPGNATPEALVALTTQPPLLLILSDDGTVMIDGRPAKEHPNPERRVFRGFLRPLELFRPETLK